MPEGDTVYRAARVLHRALAGQTLVNTDFRVPQLATTSLAGQKVVEVLSRGKHILLRTDAGWSLHTHFMMEGEWKLFRMGEPWKGGPAFEIRLVLQTREWVAVGYRMPVLEVLRTEDEGQVVGHLGPDLLGPDWNLEEAVARLASRPELELGEALLDQRSLAGIGNIFKNETMFLRGDNPFAPVAGTRDLKATVALARRLMLANRDQPGRSTTGSRRPADRFYVFEGAGQPCRRCGTPIERRPQAHDPALRRLTYWCPHCQGGTGPGRSLRED